MSSGSNGNADPGLVKDLFNLEVSSTQVKISWDIKHEKFKHLKLYGYQLKLNGVSKYNEPVVSKYNEPEQKDFVEICLQPETTHVQLTFTSGEEKILSPWLNIKTSHSGQFVYALFLIFGLITTIVLIPLFISQCNVFNKMHSYQAIGSFEEKMNELQFNNQEEFYIKMIKNAGIRHLKKVYEKNQDDLRPLSFLIAGYKGTERTMVCFIRKIGDAFTHKKYAIIDSSDYVGEKSKEQLDTKIKDTLNSEQKFIIIKDIDKLSFETAQLFMSYADEHDSVASYPQSTILLTTQLPFEHEVNISRNSDEGKVYLHFINTVWNGADKDAASALWSRVGDGIVLLKNEKKLPC